VENGARWADYAPKLIAAALVVWFCSLPDLMAQHPTVPAGELDRAVILALQTSGASSVSVAIVEGGHTVYAKAFGKANIQNDTSATPETRYAIGSISKQFTAVALLLEQEKGKLSLKDKVGKYFPDLTQAKDVTIRELLSHTSGYEDYAPQDYLIPDWTKPTSATDILQRWARKPLNFTPGTQWQYSNTNFVLAAQIFEKVSGEPLVLFLHKTIFEPLGMTSAGNCTVRGSADAQAYTRYALGPPRPVGREAEGWYLGAAELCMTAPDLAKWNTAVIGKRILSAKSYGEFTEDVKLADGKPTHYGLGVQVGEFHETPQIMHSGEVSGFLAMNRVCPAKGIAVTVLSNEDGVNLIGPLSEQLALMMLQPGQSAENEKVDGQIRGILDGLRAGQVDRGLFTPDANSYFSQTSLEDYRRSLEPLGPLKFLIRQSTQQRGGMTHLNYRAQYERKTVTLNIYRLPSGKFEQFMVEGQAE
jgi:CubicO group peptidase (beta-lactamase class C family)